MKNQQVTEAPIEDIICKMAEDDFWLVRKVSWVGRRAAPDRLFAKHGRVVLIEFKRPGADARKQQKAEHVRFREAGIEVHVCDSILSAMTVLNLI